MIGITDLKRIYTAQEALPLQLGQIVGPPEGLPGWFKFIKYSHGTTATAVRGIRGMNVEYARPATSTNDIDTAGEPGKNVVTADTSAASNLTGGVLVGDSPPGLVGGGGVYQDGQFGFAQLAGPSMVDIWMPAMASPAIQIALDELIYPHGTNDGISDGVAFGSASAPQVHQAFGFALADGELIANDQCLVTAAAAGWTGANRFRVGETVTATGTGASGTAVVNEIFSSSSGGVETQWGMRITGTSFIIATSGNTTLTGGTSAAVQALALLRFSGRIKGKNVMLTLPLI